jgi:hypothetical protein
MEFTLECIQEQLNFEQTNLFVKPSSLEIRNYVGSGIIVNTDEITPTMINDFITEQTPLLFGVFQSMENIPLEIRNKYIL